MDLGYRVKLNEKAYIDIKTIGETDMPLDPRNKLWLIETLGIPSDDPEEANDDGYESLGYDTYHGFIISANNKESACSHLAEKLSDDIISYDTSHWTIELVGIDTKAKVSNPYIVISDFTGA